MRATSRWLVKRIFPSLVKRRRRRRCPSGDTADQAHGDAVPDAEILPRALAPTRRRDRGGHDVLEPEAGAGATVVTGRPAAVLDRDTGQRVLPVPPEEVPVQARRDVVPRQGLGLPPVPVAHLLDAQPLGLQGLLPQGEVEALGPFLEGAAG